MNDRQDPRTGTFLDGHHAGEMVDTVLGQNPSGEAIVVEDSLYHCVFWTSWYDGREWVSGGHGWRLA